MWLSQKWTNPAKLTEAVCREGLSQVELHDTASCSGPSNFPRPELKHVIAQLSAAGGGDASADRTVSLNFEEINKPTPNMMQRSKGNVEMTWKVEKAQSSPERRGLFVPSNNSRVRFFPGFLPFNRRRADVQGFLAKQFLQKNSLPFESELPRALHF
jgi:hypothetical protein